LDRSKQAGLPIRDGPSACPKGLIWYEEKLLAGRWVVTTSLSPEQAWAAEIVVAYRRLLEHQRHRSTSNAVANRSLPSPLGVAHPCPARHLVETPKLAT
jgi:hypothetical protein